MIYTKRSAGRVAAVGLTALGIVGSLAVAPTPAQAAIGDEFLDDSATWSLWADGTDPSGGGDTLDWTSSDFAADGWQEVTGVVGRDTTPRPGPDAYPEGRPEIDVTLEVGDEADPIETYFLRTDVTVSIEDLDAATGFHVDANFDDGFAVYVNGAEAFRTQTLEGMDLAADNLQYAIGQSTDMERTGFTLDASFFTPGENTIAVSLHNHVSAEDSDPADIYFHWQSMTSEYVPSPSEDIYDLGLNVGADETQVNLAWMSNNFESEVVQIARAEAMSGNTFPVAEASEFSAERPWELARPYATKATVTGLEPNTDYVYRVGSEGGGWSAVYDYSTQDFDDDFNFLFYGDMQVGSGDSLAGDTEGWTQAVETSHREFPESSFMLSAGDQVEVAFDREEYSAFFTPDGLREKPLATNVGNHDFYSTQYDKQFHLPNESNRRYWFTHNNVLVISINSNDPFFTGHFNFIEDVVAEHGSGVDWTVVTYHHSTYSSATHASDLHVKHLRERMSPVLSEVGVDLVLAGHDHIHTRSHLMSGTTPNEPDTTVVADGDVNQDAATCPAAGDVHYPADDEVLYLTGSSSSGSKFYSDKTDDPEDGPGIRPYVACSVQDNTPDFTNVEVSPVELTVTTYNVADMSVVDRVTLSREESPVSTPEPTEPGETEQPTETTEPSETAEPTEMPVPTETLLPTEPGETAEPTETTDPTAPSGTGEPTETGEPTDPSATAEPTGPETVEPDETETQSPVPSTSETVVPTPAETANPSSTDAATAPSSTGTHTPAESGDAIPGAVVPDQDAPGSEVAEPADGDDALARTGAEGLLPAIVTGALIAIAGAGTLMIRRRASQQ